jgi:hypothetical protein
MGVHSMMLEFSGHTDAPLSSCSGYMTHWGVHQVAVDARRNVELLSRGSFVLGALAYLRARYRTLIVLRFNPVRLSIIVFFYFFAFSCYLIPYVYFFVMFIFNFSLFLPASGISL